jgi:hypothetical protein
MASASALWWLAIPVVATLLAVGWVGWSSRDRPPADMHDTVAEYERFKAAIEGRPARRRGKRKRG